MNDFFTMYNNMNLVNRISSYIDAELNDSAYYKMLADSTQNNLYKNILLEFSNDEYTHAQNFMQAYYLLTGKRYMPLQNSIPQNNPITDFDNALKMRILDETKDYKKYAKESLEAPNKQLHDLFYLTSLDEAIHAMRIPIMLS